MQVSLGTTIRLMIRGSLGLVASKKGVLSLLVLGTTGLLSMSNHMSPSVAACLAVVQGIYCWTAHRTDIAQMSNKGGV